MIKKAILNSIILSTENASGICSMIANQVYFYGAPIYDMHDKLKNLDFETFKKATSGADLSNRSVVVLESED